MHDTEREQSRRQRSNKQRNVPVRLAETDEAWAWAGQGMAWQGVAWLHTQQQQRLSLTGGCEPEPVRGLSDSWLSAAAR